MYSGGLEMLFSHKRKHFIPLPAVDENGGASNLAYLVRYLCDKLMRGRKKELFVLDDTVFVDYPTVDVCLLTPPQPPRNSGAR